ncbi:hypothetical protein [Sphingomonas aracearum]|uniref:hypothetical protein n=1 Tax=Sphingomonas aracearum TaxID=2283317 RepID=UPI0011C03BD3|nr:hypothetical protein [Sphingomonas aracearum]
MANNTKRDVPMIAIIGGVVVLLFVAQATGLAGDPPKPQPTPTFTHLASTGPSNAYRLMMAETDVKKRLRDPSSADFSAMTVHNDVVCGTVNSRNGFGGMTGQQRFISRMGVMTVFADDVAGDGFRETWNRVC